MEALRTILAIIYCAAAVAGYVVVAGTLVYLINHALGMI